MAGENCQPSAGTVRQSSRGSYRKSTTDYHYRNKKVELMKRYTAILTFGIILLLTFRATAQEDSLSVAYPRLYGGLTFTRIEWGFSRLIDNGSFQLSDNHKFLS